MGESLQVRAPQAEIHPDRTALPEIPVINETYEDLTEHHQTLWAPVADLNAIWGPSNSTVPDDFRSMQYPEWSVDMRWQKQAPSLRGHAEPHSL